MGKSIYDEICDQRKNTTINEGFVDGEHRIIRCNRCSLNLIDIWITRPNMPMKTCVKAKCFQCDQETEKVIVSGAFEIGFTDDAQITDLEYDDEPSRESGGYTIAVTAKTATNR